MRVKLFAAVSTIAAVAALTGAVLSAEEPRRVRRAGLQALQSDIGLSDEQMAELRRIRSGGRKAAIRRNAEMRIARLELDEILGAATVDEARIAARVKAISDLQAAAFKDRIESRLAVRRLVTAEQYQKMQQQKRRAVRARRGRLMRRPMAGESGSSGPGDAEDLAAVYRS